MKKKEKAQQIRKRKADITSRTEDLQRLSTELTTIMDAVPGLVFYKDDKNRFIRVNQFVADAHNMTKEELEGKNCFDLYPHDMAQAYLDDDLEVIRSGQAKLNFVEQWKSEEGERWVSTSKIPYVDSDGQITGVIGVSMDVTELKRAEAEITHQYWLKSGMAELSEYVRGEQTVEALGRSIVAKVVQYIGADVGALYIAEEGGMLRLTAGYAHDLDWKAEPRTFEPGQGLIGQVAAGKNLLRLQDIPLSSVRLVSGLLEITLSELIYAPLLLGDRVKGVIEIGSIHPMEDRAVEFLESVGETIAVALNSGELRERQQSLLKETKRFNEELQAQQEELRVTNEELEEQAQALRASEEKLKAQQEELEVTNEELEEKTEMLERQKRDVEQARREISEKAEDLSLASKYKSEFLANMSHELRSPLNSLLLLARSLSENKEGNLTSDQVESAQVIYHGGNELLSLINDILDLSKIEAGRMDLQFEEIRVSELCAVVQKSFEGLAQQKGIAIEVLTTPDAPERIVSDRKRVEQILKNLVTNAVKFTEAGHVKVAFGTAKENRLSIAVEDTGIGIPAEQRKGIFAPFQQGDGSTARRYGGTGLGLSIVTQLLGILGGEIELQSEQGKGSTFTVYLPVDQPLEKMEQVSAVRLPVAAETPQMPANIVSIEDDRDAIKEKDRSVLIIEDDIKFAKILARQCREQGFKVLASSTGEGGIELARRFGPSGIILDINLPGMDGWQVLEQLKENPDTRHIPVHIASVDESSPAALKKGAIGYLQKPVSAEQIGEALTKIAEISEKKKKRVLVVEDDNNARKGIVKLLSDGDVVVDEAADGVQAIRALRSRRYDCMVLDLGLRDLDGKDILKRIEGDRKIEMPPVIIHTGRDMTWEEDLELRSYSSSVVIKGVCSDERLFDEVSLFLHRVVADMPEKKRRVITSLHDADALLRGKTVLLVDDDMRALFALTRILTDRGMHVIKANNGEKAIELLDREKNVDVVLMDIMMPVMDGYEAMNRIRAQERFRKLPMIALTAKAMRGDREVCIEAGANDYLSKPIDPDRLISMLRVWLYR